MEKTVVVSVNNTAERDMIVKNIYNQYTMQWPEYYTVQQDQINRIKVFHKEDNVPQNLKSHYCTYIVIIIPVLVNLDPLDSFIGLIDFNLQATIIPLKKLIKKLESLQGERVIKENPDAASLEELVGLLPGTE